MKTYMPTPLENKKKWYLVNAQGKVLGRLSSKIAQILSGKNKPTYVPFLDTGDFVVVINAEKVILTGKKAEQKTYYHHSGYPGGLKSIKYSDLLKKNPSEIIRLAVKGMLPHNKLGQPMLKKLKVYKNSYHPHKAQNLITLEV